MKKITIIAVGKLKEKYWNQAEIEYIKRLSPYVHIQIIELKEIAFSDKDAVEIIKEKEAKIINNKIPKDTVLITLHEVGKQMDSIQFSQWLSKKTEHGEHLCFIIGGPKGLHISLLQKSQQISLSQLTFPHQMVRTILLEQLYRASTIEIGKTYHY